MLVVFIYSMLSPFFPLFLKKPQPRPLYLLQWFRGSSLVRDHYTYIQKRDGKMGYFALKKR